ncbi:hypothetical protein VNO80_10943 [Phaseolus coccineus]|uniref:Protein kinase domain-containing protein n=1 Tax=Phaseolus coccineus TaxID=3886 RepID=A0AAN9N953_PHACN
MNRPTLIFIIGICIGFVVGMTLTLPIVFWRMRGRKRTKVDKSISHRAVTIPVKVKGSGSNSTLSEGEESPRTSEWSNTPLWLENLRRSSAISACGIPKYSYKDIQKATSNFTTTIGNGAFGPVYKAHMATGETVAVKVLGTNSKQGEQEFLTEVLLLGRLHHRNLVDLVGYVAERGKHMLLYTYMSNGSLASHLYDFGKNHEPLNWDLRLGIALDVARGLEYLHCGASPPVVHRDIKSCNILLDQSMKAKAAMEGEGKVGWEEIVDGQLNGIYDVHNLNDMASLAFICVNEVSKSRPPMCEIVQALSQLCKRQSKNLGRTSSAAALKDVCIEVDDIETKDFTSTASTNILGRMHSR